MKACLIEQSCGLGDILLSIKIGHYFANQGYDVIWPIEQTYDYLSEYILVDNINFYNIEKHFPYKNEYFKLVRKKITEVTEYDEFLYIPLKNSFFSAAGQTLLKKTGYHDHANMHGKYAMCSLNHSSWQDFFDIKRNNDKEEELFCFLNLQNKKYHLVNKNFGTPPRWKETLKEEINTPYGVERVEMAMYSNFTAFDWLKVYEKADRIDTVSTSNFYLFEKIDLKCIPAIYSRNTTFRSFDENFGWLQQFARKNYIFMK
jgi:hypothetical protein